MKIDAFASRSLRLFLLESMFVIRFWRAKTWDFVFSSALFVWLVVYAFLSRRFYRWRSRARIASTRMSLTVAALQARFAQFHFGFCFYLVGRWVSVAFKALHQRIVGDSHAYSTPLISLVRSDEGQSKLPRNSPENLPLGQS